MCIIYTVLLPFYHYCYYYLPTGTHIKKHKIKIKKVQMYRLKREHTNNMYLTTLLWRFYSYLMFIKTGIRYSKIPLHFTILLLLLLLLSTGAQLILKITYQKRDEGSIETQNTINVLCMLCYNGSHVIYCSVQY